MISFRKTLSLLTTVAALLLGTSASRAGLGGISDGGAFFSEQAKAEASRTIGDVERSLKKDIVIETFGEIPAAVKSGADLADKAAASRLFVQWAEKQAKQQGVSGVYILLVKQPSHLQIVVGNQTLKQSFTAMDREVLASTMLTKLRAKQNDAALLDGVHFISSTMHAHAGATGHAAPAQRSGVHPVTTGSWSGWILPVVLGLLVAWVVFGLLRSLLNRGSAGGMGMPQGSGGGGFFSSLIGGMFGAAAGMWMYDQFLGSHGNAADRTDTAGSGDGGASEQDTDYSSSGGDFGDDSGGSGGDSGGGFGGGDSGGGDSGGGDF